MFYLHRAGWEKLLEKVVAKSLMHLLTSCLCSSEHGKRDDIRGLSKSKPLQYSDSTFFTSAAYRLFVGLPVQLSDSFKTW